MEKLIVPFLFGIEENSRHYGWIFYKYMDFCLQNHYPLIAEEAYFAKPSIYESQNEYPFQDIVDDYNYKHGFARPTDENMEILQKYPISNIEKEKIIALYATMKEAAIHLLQERDETFETIVMDKLTKIEEEVGEIAVIMTWTWYPSLEYCCQSKNIKVLLLEQTTFRPDTYRFKLGYFQFYDKYDNHKMDDDYSIFLEQFKDRKDYLNRKELLSLFLATDQLDILKKLEDPPEYEFGFNVGPDYDPLAEANCQMDEIKLLQDVEDMVGKDQIYLSIHPMHKKEVTFAGYSINKERNSLAWILKNKRTVSIGSNLAFETMLAGRTAYVLGGNFPYRKGAITELEQLEDKIVELKYINYIIFAYYAPYDLMFDKDYILWRLTNPTLLEIYDYNINYVLTKYAEIKKNLFSYPVMKREKIILDSHNLSEDKKHELLSERNVSSKRIQELEEAFEQKCIAYQAIVQSKSWKITKPLRFFMRKRKLR